MKNKNILFLVGVSFVAFVNAENCEVKKFQGYISGNRAQYAACVAEGRGLEVEHGVNKAIISAYRNINYSGGMDAKNLLRVLNDSDLKTSKLVSYQPLFEQRQQTALADLYSVKGDIEQADCHLRNAISAHLAMYAFPLPVNEGVLNLLITDHTVEEFKACVLTLNECDQHALLVLRAELQQMCNDNERVVVLKAQAFIDVINEKLLQLQEIFLQLRASLQKECSDYVQGYLDDVNKRLLEIQNAENLVVHQEKSN